MDVVVLASQKGGAGKTTLTGHLAVAAGNHGLSPVVVIDTDPQGSLTSWWHRRQADVPLLSTLPSLRDLPARVEELRRSGVALVIIDTPPATTNAIREAMRVADLVVMPVRPSPHDLDAIGATIDLARQAEAQFVFVLTQAKLNARVTPQAAALLSAHGTVASSIIQDRVIYASAMTDGRTANDIDPKGAAAAEILALWLFIQGRMTDGTKDGKERREKVA
jgi:chromosome partitioning protein